MASVRTSSKQRFSPEFLSIPYFGTSLMRMLVRTFIPSSGKSMFLRAIDNSFSNLM